MDCQSIYDHFIADRRFKKHDADTYTESHHVLPRSLGGGDGAENLIDLLPEDHFFAHLLLAKIHGGMLWVPVVMWLGGDRRNWAGRRSRLEYGWAKKAAIQTVSGSGAHQYDHTVYWIEHKDGRTFHGTQAEISVAFGLTKSVVNLLVNGKMASLRGWYLEGKRPAYVGRGSPHGRADEDQIQTCGRARVRRHATRTPHRARRIKIGRLQSRKWKTFSLKRMVRRRQVAEIARPRRVVALRPSRSSLT